ncbi:hypothetical protein U1Q18_042250 [Sarracenia purpurea var. burkii]
MATKPLTTEAIALTEKKMNMTLVVVNSACRFRAQLVQRKATNETFSGKATRLLFWKHTLGPLYCTQKPQSLGNAVPKQRPQTLDLLFANMKEQRMRALSQQNNGRRRNGGGQLRQQWGRGRGRFGN